MLVRRISCTLQPRWAAVSQAKKCQAKPSSIASTCTVCSILTYGSWTSALRKKAGTAFRLHLLSPVPDQQMLDCVAQFRHWTVSGIINVFNSGTGLPEYRKDRHSGVLINSIPPWPCLQYRPQKSDFSKKISSTFSIHLDWFHSVFQAFFAEYRSSVHLV